MPEYLQKVWQNEGQGNEQEQNEEGLAAGYVVSLRLLKSGRELQSQSLSPG